MSGLEIPENLPWDSDLQTYMVEKMHKLGLSQAQVQGVLSGYVEFTGSQFEQNAGDSLRDREAAVQGLKRALRNGYAAQVDYAKRALMTRAGENYDKVRSLWIAAGGSLWQTPVLLSLHR